MRWLVMSRHISQEAERRMLLRNSFSPFPSVQDPMGYCFLCSGGWGSLHSPQIESPSQTCLEICLQVIPDPVRLSSGRECSRETMGSRGGGGPHELSLLSFYPEKQGCTDSSRVKSHLHLSTAGKACSSRAFQGQGSSEDNSRRIL